jgi:hypothetical protein
MVISPPLFMPLNEKQKRFTNTAVGENMEG